MTILFRYLETLLQAFSLKFINKYYFFSNNMPDWIYQKSLYNLIENAMDWLIFKKSFDFGIATRTHWFQEHLCGFWTVRINEKVLFLNKTHFVQLGSSEGSHMNKSEFKWNPGIGLNFNRWSFGPTNVWRKSVLHILYRQISVRLKNETKRYISDLRGSFIGAYVWPILKGVLTTDTVQSISTWKRRFWCFNKKSFKKLLAITYCRHGKNWLNLGTGRLAVPQLLLDFIANAI